MNTLDEDIEKMTQKLKGRKRRFRIEAGRYGGELTIGRISPDFVEYWLNKDADQEELIEHINSFEWEDEDGRDFEAPEIDEEFNAWFDTDDIEHLNGAYSDGEWVVYEVPADGSDDYDYDIEQTFEANHLYSREAYHNDSAPETMDDDMVPVLAFHSGEKGSFGCWFVETDGDDFDAEKLWFSSCETNISDIVERVWYNKEELDTEFDYADTTGKGFYASIGWMNKKWHDSYDTYTDEYLEENGYFDDL
jgi:hypothetical protein